MNRPTLYIAAALLALGLLATCAGPVHVGDDRWWNGGYPASTRGR